MIDDYAAVVARAFTEPYTDEIRQLVRVCGDHFEDHGDPRGTLIALGEARYDVTGPRAHELQQSIDAHVLEHHVEEIGRLADLVKKPRTCVLEWRCGQLFAASIDTRHFKDLAVFEIIGALLRAPAARTLRRLTFRVRIDRDIPEVLSALRDAPDRPPLEQLSVLREVRPRRLLSWTTGNSTSVVARYPELHFYAEADAIHALMPSDLPQDVHRIVVKIEKVAAPLDRHERSLLGRALTYPDPVVRDAAFKKLAELGEHGAVFVDLLALLLEPGLVAPLPIITALATMGRAARRALPVLVQIPGRTTHYDTDARRAAGKLVGALTQQMPDR